MKSAKFIACCFVEVPNDDVFYNYEFKDSWGKSHVVVGKRGDWLYITDDDMIFTVSQLFKVSCVQFENPGRIFSVSVHGFPPYAIRANSSDLHS